MKKLFLIATLVFFSNVAANAGWADSMRQPCDPAKSKPNTCFYYPDGLENRGTDDDSTLTYLVTLIAEYNPFIFFLT